MVAEGLTQCGGPIVTTPIASDGKGPVAIAKNTACREPGKPDGRRSLRLRIVGLVGESVLLLLVVLLFPLVILVIGTPVALLAKLLIETAKRL
jgi:hypothetical protein